MKRWIYAATGLLLACGAVGAQTNYPDKPIKLIVGFTPGGGIEGDGIKLAVQEINAAGGINGSMLEIVVRDEQLKPDVATAAAKELITKEGVKAIIERNLTLFVQRVLLPPRRSSGWDWSRCPPPSSTPSSTSSTADWRCASSGGSPSTSTRPTCRT